MHGLPFTFRRLTLSAAWDVDYGGPGVNPGGEVGAPTLAREKVGGILGHWSASREQLRVKGESNRTRR